jgi:hypothetical protein
MLVTINTRRLVCPNGGRGVILYSYILIFAVFAFTETVAYVENSKSNIVFPIRNEEIVLGGIETASVV